MISFQETQGGSLNESYYGSENSKVEKTAHWTQEFTSTPSPKSLYNSMKGLFFKGEETYKPVRLNVKETTAVKFWKLGKQSDKK